MKGETEQQQHHKHKKLWKIDFYEITNQLLLKTSDRERLIIDAVNYLKWKRNREEIEKINNHA